MLRLCRFLQIAILMAFMLPAAHAADTDAIQVSRYTEITAVSPADFDPLNVVAQLRFPRETVTTVGDALAYLLQRTGYRARAADNYGTRLFTLPLPESQRQVGPYRVLSLAQLMIGESFAVCIDRFERVLNIQATAPGHTCPVSLPVAPAAAQLTNNTK